MKKLLFVMVSIFALTIVSCNKGVGSVKSVDTTDTTQVDSTHADPLDSVSSDSLGK